MVRPLELSGPLRPAGLLLAFGLALALPGLARGAEIRMHVSPIGCWSVVSGVAGCAAAPDTIVDITFALDATQTLNGYDLEIRWNAGELTLISATQLHPDTGTPATFLEQPSDPADSRAAVFEFSAAATSQLFRLRFQTGGALVLDGQADLSWFPNSNGLAPASVVLENAAGAAIDFGPPPADVPAVNLAGRALLGLLLSLFALRDRLLAG